MNLFVNYLKESEINDGSIKRSFFPLTNLTIIDYTCNQTYCIVINLLPNQITIFCYNN